MIPEIWLQIPGYEGLYEQSIFGRTRSMDHISYHKDGSIHQPKKGKIRKYELNGRGYLSMRLHKDGRTKHFCGHTLTALTFLPNTENKPQINHKNGNKLDNHIQNIEWCTGSENCLHAIRTGLNPTKRGKKYPRK